MKQTFAARRPILTSVLYTLLILLFPVGAGVVVSVVPLGEVAALLVQAAFFALAAGVLALIVARRPGGFRAAGLQKPRGLRGRTTLWFLPLMLVEILPLLRGVNSGLSMSVVLATLLLTLCVGFTEEFYFRGIIFGTLRGRSVRLAVWLSSLLFGVGHLSNLAGGADVVSTLLQVVFAVLFGLVAAEIALQTRSLLVPICWHISHNFIAFTSAVWPQPAETILLGVQCAVLLGYAVYLHKQSKVVGAEKMPGM